jgi:hypothetical protein
LSGQFVVQPWATVPPMMNRSGCRSWVVHFHRRRGLVLRVPAISRYLAHGTQDKLVPVDVARRSVEQLEQAGANVAYCENDVGHKLGADCFCAPRLFCSHP